MDQDVKKLENPIDVIREILDAKLVKPNGYPVDQDDILEYLSIYSTEPKGIPRLYHFKRYVTGKLSPD